MFQSSALSALLALIPMAAQSQVPTDFVRLRDDQDTSLDKISYSFSSSQYAYTLTAYGKLTSIANNKTTKQKQINLNHGFITSFQYAVIDAALILILSIEDGEGGWCKIYKFDQAKLKPVWATDFLTFNAGPPLVHDNFLLLTGIGTIAKLDLSTGKFAWKYNNYYDRSKYSFNNFIKPVFEDDKVTFTEKLTRGHQKYDTPKQIIVDYSSGKPIQTLSPSVTN